MYLQSSHPRSAGQRRRITRLHDAVLLEDGRLGEVVAVVTGRRAGYIVRPVGTVDPGAEELLTLSAWGEYGWCHERRCWARLGRAA
jgi:hypothetical protein